MKIVVTGSLGHISQPLTKLLAQQGHAVTVISSQPDRRPAIEALGAVAAIGSVDNADFLAAAFAGAEAVYAMIPPNFGEPDARAYYQRVGNSYAQAVERAGVPRVVHLSSWGADLSAGTGFIVGSHDVENRLNKLADVAVTHLRAGYIYYNLLAYMSMIKSQGLMGANYGGDDPLVLVAPADIAAAAAEELTTPATGQRVRYVASDERTAADTARVLGAAIGQPGLQWLTFTNEQMRASLEHNGVPAHMAASLVELGASIHSGALRQDYDLHKPSRLGKVKLEDFAREFAAAFNQ